MSAVAQFAALMREEAGDNGPGGRQPLFLGGYLTAWDAVTHANTVAIGTVSFSNLPAIDPAGLSIGPVLLAHTDDGPVVLGRIYRYQQEDEEV
ncbi:hypothetical protein [Pseudonocardia pini]|uniref:hypothetical protein n=1 Tax=Pseudonocardia pini TaxID=2758030 RepID=UPI0015F09DF3|nr:hypothetical protein [Pseudonocardia pini]